ncbi:large-conductance mechanosensitive channel protein MscL [Patescibacteria group bacterium]|nr:MAG: large-conductance mechanosensitive channel protein MscL [Patescibacteria group bacterium]
MKIIEEFKQFAIRGSVVDLAVGVIVGGAFGKIVTSFVNDILMPPLGLLLGGVNFADLRVILKGANGDNPAITLNYGNFIQTTVDFLIIAFFVFLMVKGMTILRRRNHKAEENSEVKDTKSEQLLTEIRDLLKK